MKEKKNCEGQKPVYFVFRVHICALTYEWADTPWKDTYGTRSSSYYGAVSVAGASGWEGASLSLRTPWYSVVLCGLIRDYTDYLSIKYPEREGWQTQCQTPEAHSLGEEKSHRPRHPTTWPALGGNLPLPMCLSNQPLSHFCRPETFPPQLPFRSTLPFCFPTCNTESGKVQKTPKLRGSVRVAKASLLGAGCAEMVGHR